MENNYSTSDTKPQENSVSIIDLLLKIIDRANFIGKIVLYFLIAGILIAIFKPSKYQASSIVVNEAISLDEMNFSGGLSTLRKFGINLGPPGEGLTLEAYPNIITSREVLYEVIQDTFYFSDKDTSMRLVDYINYKDFFFYLKKYTIKLPKTIFRFFFPKKKFTYPSGEAKGQNILFISEGEYEALKVLSSEFVNVDSDIETGLITISVTTFDPNLSASINATLLQKFRHKMQQIYDKKASENLNFIRARFMEAKEELRNAEEEVVKFLEKNSEPTTINLQTELERLKRNVSFKAEVYSELQSQLTQTEIELKRKEPVIRILERPSPPKEPLGPSRSIIVLLFVFLGLILALSVIISLIFIEHYTAKFDPDGKKVQKIKIFFTGLKSIVFRTK